MKKSFGNSLSKKNKIIITVASLSLTLLLIVTVVVYLNSSSFDLRNFAQTLCTEPLNVSVSSDNKNYSSGVEFTGVPERYYIKATSCGQAVSTSLDANSTYCDFQNKCNASTVSSPWGYYRTNKQGIARIDIKEVSPALGTYTATFRSNGSLLGWSNKITISIKPDTNKNSVTSIEDTLKDYIYNIPGYSYQYRSNNTVNKASGNTYLQIEREASWCGTPVFPWRFTKDTATSYWNPVVSNLNSVDRNTFLRWMIVNPSYNAASTPNWNNYLWALGDKRYSAHYDTLNFSEKDFVNLHFYDTNLINYPGYLLAPKKLNFPYSIANNSSSYNPSSVEKNYCGNASYVPNYATNGSWKIRIEKENIDIKSPVKDGFSYKGEAVRIDYFEGTAPIMQGQMIRESWYYVKNIGLVRIVVKHFNKYGNLNTSIAKPCIQDSDCISDSVDSPQIDVVLTNYFKNPAFIAQVSKDGKSFSNSISIKSGLEGYYLKVTDPKDLGNNNSGYTGFLEARDAKGNIFKWNMSRDGIVKISASELKDLAAGDYKAQFRIWAPNDNFAQETRTTAMNSVNIPWSNQINVTIIK